MNQPYFSGVERTESELRLIEDSYVPLYVNDVLWILALPENANRDHAFCNPLIGKVKRLPRCMVDRGKNLVKLLESFGVQVVSLIVEGGFHGAELTNVTAAQELYNSIKDFILSV
ncbi:hypothetical protein RD792_011703 [Penstemon davidsonii]|uniref:Uncharacterized protein n=1 Tax=Penstemon davidsonii TaxID=160366 RepID=A0ABR0CWE0_9LAMI|nr:hypothetical protein RD792_011703 [Penstemon davidsonii]